MMVVAAAATLFVSALGHSVTFGFSFTNDPALGTTPGTVTEDIVELSDNELVGTRIFNDPFYVI